MELKNKNILFIINSNKKFYNTTIPKTLESLNKNNIKDICVIVGGWESEFEFQYQCQFYGTTYDSCDYTTFNYIVDNPDKFKHYTHIFYMHDTCWVGENFLSKLIELTPDTPTLGYSLLPLMSMNIGLYDINYLINTTDNVRRSKNTDNSLESLNKWKQWGAQHEDYIIRKEGHYCNPANEETKPENVYGTITPRRTRYFSDLDFYKSQSNWQGILEKMNTDL